VSFFLTQKIVTDSWKKLQENMKKLYPVFLFCFVLGFAQNKKGIGLTESEGLGIDQLEQLNVGWYYNWGLVSKVATDRIFVPMCFSLKSINKIQKSDVILGFNEPDNDNQANVAVLLAVENWHYLQEKSIKIGSPALAKNVLKKGNWLDFFLESKPKVDFIALHWYKGCDADKFILDLKKVIQKYQLPVWVTEFAPQTTSQSKLKPLKYSEKEVAEFIKKTVKWMENEQMIEKYAWHNSKFGTSALFTTSGELTATGKVYRDAK
jgi:hypothetical protein